MAWPSFESSLRYDTNNRSHHRLLLRSKKLAILIILLFDVLKSSEYGMLYANQPVKTLVVFVFLDRNCISDSVDPECQRQQPNLFWHDALHFRHRRGTVQRHKCWQCHTGNPSSAPNCIKHFHWTICLFWPIRFDVTIVSSGNTCNAKPDWPESP